MKAGIQVMKFGGTSVGNAACVARAAEIIAAAASEVGVVAVVSAMSGVTNRLIEAAKRSETGDASISDELAVSLRTQHSEAAAILVGDDARRAGLEVEAERIIEEVMGLCRGTALLCELTPRALDAISSVGERLSARCWRARCAS